MTATPIFAMHAHPTFALPAFSWHRPVSSAMNDVEIIPPIGAAATGTHGAAHAPAPMEEQMQQFLVRVQSTIQTSVQSSIQSSINEVRQELQQTQRAQQIFMSEQKLLNAKFERFMQQSCTGSTSSGTGSTKSESASTRGASEPRFKASAWPLPSSGVPQSRDTSSNGAAQHGKQGLSRTQQCQVKLSAWSNDVTRDVRIEGAMELINALNGEDSPFPTTVDPVVKCFEPYGRDVILQFADPEEARQFLLRVNTHEDCLCVGDLVFRAFRMRTRMQFIRHRTVGKAIRAICEVTKATPQQRQALKPDYSKGFIWMNGVQVARVIFGPEGPQLKVHINNMQCYGMCEASANEIKAVFDRLLQELHNGGTGFS